MPTKQTINQVKICAPRPDNCEALINQVLPGIHELTYYSNGLSLELIREIQSIGLYQEGEGSFEYAHTEGTITVEEGDVCCVMEFNHGTFNLNLVADGVLQSQLTYIVPRGGLTSLASMIKQDALFPNSIREIDEDLIVNAIARRHPKMPLTYQGLSFEDSFKRSVVPWIRASYSEAKNFWKKTRGRDWVSSINKILCAGGAAPLSVYWQEWIRDQAQAKEATGDATLVQEATAMRLLADNITICPNSRMANAKGMLELDPVPGFVAAVDFGYSAVKVATSADTVSLMPSAIALPFSKVNLRDIREGSCYIQLKSGPLFEQLKKSGQPTSYVFGTAANSIMGAEKVINNAKEQFIPQACLAALSPTMAPSPDSKKLSKAGATIDVLTNS